MVGSVGCWDEDVMMGLMVGVVMLADVKAGIRLIGLKGISE